VSRFELLFSSFRETNVVNGLQANSSGVKRLAARRNAILNAARDAAADGGNGGRSDCAGGDAR